MNRLSFSTRVSLLALIAALAMPSTLEAKPRLISASAQPVIAGQEIQFAVTVGDDSHDIAWYKVWLEGQPEPSGRTDYSSPNPKSLSFGNPGGNFGGRGNVSIKLTAPARNTRIFFKVRCVKNEDLVDSVMVTVRAPAPPVTVPTNIATKITSARYSNGTIEIALDGIAGSNAKIEADIWPVGGQGKRCIDQGLNPQQREFNKNVSGFLGAPGRYQSRVHLIRSGQLVHYFDISNIVK